MVLTREAIEAGFIDRMVAQQGGMPDKWSIEQIRESYRRILADAPPGDLWIFAYGSLLWNPTVHVAEARIAHMRGYHRRFCLRTTLGRGSPEMPGLILGLEPGGSCSGQVLRVVRADAERELELLFRREMIAGSYTPKWLPVTAVGLGRIKAMTFIMNRRHERYTGRLSEEDVVHSIACAAGPLGKCSDYLDQTVASLAALGLEDKAMTRLQRLVNEHRERHAKS
jgi:cation transport protein ChaC